MSPGGNGPILINKGVFWNVWTQNQSFLLSLSIRWVNGNEGEAREIMSGAMMRALDHLGSKDVYIRNPKAWLARILRNHCIDTLRVKARNPDFAVDLEFLIHSKDHLLHKREHSPERHLVENEDYERVKAAVEALPDRLRSVMILRAYQDMPYKEIAMHLEITPATARKRIQEARSMVRDLLSPTPTTGQNRSRKADPNLNSPRSERKAAEEELVRDIAPDYRMEPMAFPVRTDLDRHLSLELPIATSQRPIRIQQKLDAANKYIGKHPGGWTKRRERASLLAVQGKIHNAIEGLNQVLERQPQQVDTLLMAALWLQWADLIPEAIKTLEKGLPIVHKGAWRHIFEGRIKSLQGNHIEATKSFEQACLKAPRPACQLLLAESLMARKNWSKAAYHLKKNQSREGRLLFQACLARLNRFNERAKVILKMKENFPEDPYVMALNLEIRLNQRAVQGEAGAKTRLLLNSLRHQQPDSSLYLACRIGFEVARGRRQKALEILGEHFSSSHLTLQHLILGKIWFEKLGATDHANRVRTLLKELYPDQSPWREILYFLPWNY